MLFSHVVCTTVFVCTTVLYTQPLSNLLGLLSSLVQTFSEELPVDCVGTPVSPSLSAVNHWIRDATVTGKHSLEKVVHSIIKSHYNFQFHKVKHFSINFDLTTVFLYLQVLSALKVLRKY